MKNQVLLWIKVTILFAVTVQQSYAFSKEDILLHGFASQGFLKSSKNHFLGKTEKGSYEFHEVGINIAVPVTDELRFGIQLFSRDLGIYGNNDLFVDWAFLTYEWQSWLKFRAGKIKFSFGLYGKKRDADMLRASILMPQGVYAEAGRDIMNAYHGFEIYGNFVVGDLGDVDYSIALGTVDVPLDSQFAKSVVRTFETSNAQVIIDDSAKIDIFHYEQVGFFWNPPVRGLRFGAGYGIGKGEGESLVEYDNLVGYDNIDVSVQNVLMLSVEYERYPFLFASEKSETIVESDQYQHYPLIIPRTRAKFEGWYASISCYVMEPLQLGVYYCEYYPAGGDQLKRVYEDYYAWQKDWTFSVRLNLNEYCAVKFESHFINGVGLCDLELNDVNSGDDIDGLMEKNWILYAVKVSMTF